MLNSVVLEENSVDIVEKRIAKNAYLQSNVTKLKKKNVLLLPDAFKTFCSSHWSKDQLCSGVLNNLF